MAPLVLLVLPPDDALPLSAQDTLKGLAGLHTDMPAPSAGVVPAGLGLTQQRVRVKLASLQDSLAPPCAVE